MKLKPSLLFWIPTFRCDCPQFLCSRMIASYSQVLRAIRPGLPYGIAGFLAISVCMLFVALLNSSIPWLLRDVINSVKATQTGTQSVMIACFAYAGAWTFASLIESLKGIFSASFLARCDAEFNRILLKTVFGYSHSIQSRMQPGEVASELERASGSFSLITYSLFWSISPVVIELAFSAFLIAKTIGWVPAIFFIAGSCLVGWM